MSDEKDLGVPAEDSGRSTAPVGETPNVRLRPDAPARNADEERETDEAEWSDDEPEEEVIGYECLGCGNVQDNNGWGGRCNACDGLSLEPMYY